MADITKLEKELWEAADDLRANSKLTSQQYCMPVLGLIFLRYAWGRFKRADARIQEERSKKTGRQAPVSPRITPQRGRCGFPRNLDTITCSCFPRRRMPAKSSTGP